MKVDFNNRAINIFCGLVTVMSIVVVVIIMAFVML